ncbi:MAG: alpha-hydroxy acid oxidase [Bryobacteraceae bacterium]
MSTAPQARREFLRFLAASPLLAKEQDGSGARIATPKDALNVMDFESLAQKGLSPAHWGYLSTGVDDDLTVRANREAMTHYQLRARRLRGADKPDLKTEVFGMTWEIPIYLSAVGYQKMFHADAEKATARAARAERVTQMLSTMTSTPVEEVSQVLGSPPWYQLYMPSKPQDTETLVRRVQDAGCPALVWTVDTLGGRNTETGTRLARLDPNNCLSCHLSQPITAPRTERTSRMLRTKPMFAGLSSDYNPGSADWTDFDRLRKMTKIKLILKGIDTGEDASLACEHGADGVVVSNHGGRATETGRGTLDVLPQVVEAVGSKIPVFVDGGFRRGSDVFKALALGARAVGIGRPYIWGLTAFGQAGVERVVQIMRDELTMTMRGCGVASTQQLTRDFLLRNGARI